MFVLSQQSARLRPIIGFGAAVGTEFGKQGGPQAQVRQRMNKLPALAYVGLGSNLDTPLDQLDAALQRLSQIRDTGLLRVSRYFRTRPWGREDQPDFVNAVAELSTTLSPVELLDALIGIEQAQGRIRIERWGPRTLDLDLLLYDSQSLESPRLQLPHPRMHERAFVLVPWLDVDPDAELTRNGERRPVEKLLAGLDQVERDGVRLTGLVLI